MTQIPLALQNYWTAALHLVVAAGASARQPGESVAATRADAALVKGP